MGLLSSRGFRNILLGAGSRYQELSKNALEIATEGQKNLREIAQNLDTVEKKAVKAMRVVEQQSDPTFTTFLSNKGIETLMEMEDKDLLAYKEQYDQLSPNDLVKLQEQDAVDLKKESGQYYTDVAENLKKSVNIGNDSANFLLDIDPRSKKFRKKVEETGAVAPSFELGEVPTVPTETLGFYGETWNDSTLKGLVDRDYIDGTIEQDLFNINLQKPTQEEIDAEYQKRLNNALSAWKQQSGTVQKTETDYQIETDEQLDEILT
jgi:hypothetical protein